MTGAVHIGIGAAIGSILRRPSVSFAAGILSHIIADTLPHKDFSAASEAVFTTAALAFVGTKYGWNSSETWGAVGAILPDIEHCLAVGKVIQPDRRFFPSHTNRMIKHGRKTGTNLGTALIFAAGIAIAEIASLRK